MSDDSTAGLITPDWPAPRRVHAFTTTRCGGVSRGPWASLNLGAHCGDLPAHVLKNRELVQSALPSVPRWLNQVHGDRVVRWEDAQGKDLRADAMTSTGSGQVCSVLTADCLPVLFCDQRAKSVAVAHAGWRGLAAGVLENTVAAMAPDAGSLMAWLGPAIGPRAFEVGREVHDAFVLRNAENRQAFVPSGDRWLADLYCLARLALARAGVGQVYGGQFCTFSDPRRFYSYRRDGETGRMATMIWIGPGEDRRQI